MKNKLKTWQAQVIKNINIFVSLMNLLINDDPDNIIDHNLPDI